MTFPMRGKRLAQILLASLVLMHCKRVGRSTLETATPLPGLTTTADKSAFVQVVGTKFSLNGRPYGFHGTNFYRLSLRDTIFSPADVDDIMTKLSHAGLEVVRVWGFSCEAPTVWRKELLDHSSSKGLSPPILDRSGKFNEAALSYLDLVIAKAGAHGLKLILPMVNFEPQYCGMAWWLQLYGDPGEGRESFYCNPKVIQAYKAYIAAILNRTNTVTRRKYKDDPAIMAIEVANEPHTADGYEAGQAIDASCKRLADGKPGTLVYQWLSNITAYVRSIDPNHLISTGEEGYRTHGGDGKTHAWIFDGSKGVDFDRNIRLPNVSFATTHLYPDNWNVPAQEFHSWFVPQVIADRAQVAHAAGKPIILEETGFATVDADDHSAFAAKVAATGYAQNRTAWLDAIYQAANTAGYAGTMVWQAVPNKEDGTAYDADSYTFSFKDPAMGSIYNQVKAMTGG